MIASSGVRRSSALQVQVPISMDIARTFGPRCVPMAAFRCSVVIPFVRLESRVTFPFCSGQEATDVCEQVYFELLERREILKSTHG